MEGGAAEGDWACTVHDIRALLAAGLADRLVCICYFSYSRTSTWYPALQEAVPATGLHTTATAIPTAFR